MYPKDYYDAMVKWMEKNNCKRGHTDYKGWSDRTGLKISAQRLSAMYKKGMVDRYKDGGVYCYQPILSCRSQMKAS